MRFIRSRASGIQPFSRTYCLEVQLSNLNFVIDRFHHSRRSFKRASKKVCLISVFVGWSSAKSNRVRMLLASCLFDFFVSSSSDSSVLRTTARSTFLILTELTTRPESAVTDFFIFGDNGS